MNFKIPAGTSNNPYTRIKTITCILKWLFDWSGWFQNVRFKLEEMKNLKTVNITMCILHTGDSNSPGSGSRAFFSALQGRKSTRNRYVTCTDRWA